MLIDRGVQQVLRHMHYVHMYMYHAMRSSPVSLCVVC